MRMPNPWTIAGVAIVGGVVWFCAPLVPLAQEKVVNYVKYDVHLGENAKQFSLAKEYALQNNMGVNQARSQLSQQINQVQAGNVAYRALSVDDLDGWQDVRRPQ